MRVLIVILIGFALAACSGSGGSNSSPTASSGTGTSSVSCPTGYLAVPGNSTLGTLDFCVAQYEMKNVGGVATSQAALAPWTSISHDAAVTACSSLGAKYSLILNSEWQTIARDVSAQATSWSAGIVGHGYMNGGAVDPSGYGFGPCDATNEYLDGSSCTNTTANFNYRRTNVLSSGGIIWDLGGNVYEMMKDLSTAGQYATGNYAYQAPATNPHGDALGTQLNAFGITPGGGWAVDNSTGNGMGYLVNYASDNSVTQRVVLRGGSAYDYSGIFLADIGWFTATDSDGYVGFRCVYHP